MLTLRLSSRPMYRQNSPGGRTKQPSIPRIRTALTSFAICPAPRKSTKLVPGTKIKVTGYKAEWSGEIEVADVESFEIEDGEYIAKPLDVTDLLGKDELIDHQNELVSFKGMTVEAAGQDADGNDVPFLYNYDGSGSEETICTSTFPHNGETYTFTVESYLCDKDTDVYKAVEALQIGDKIDMEGFLYWYEGVNPHITSVTAAE
ncbi:MAG: hypothetical protein ACLR2E_01730 [Lachnospiraceae bacterium]